MPTRFARSLDDQAEEAYRLRATQRVETHPRWIYEQPPRTMWELIVDWRLRHEGHKETPVYRDLYRTACLPDAEWQRCKLEALRYKWRYRHAQMTRLMQMLHDAWPKVLALALWAYVVLIAWIRVRLVFR